MTAPVCTGSSIGSRRSSCSQRAAGLRRDTCTSPFEMPALDRTLGDPLRSVTRARQMVAACSSLPTRLRLRQQPSVKGFVEALVSRIRRSTCSSWTASQWTSVTGPLLFLVFAGAKMLATDWIHVSPGISVAGSFSFSSRRSPRRYGAGAV
jgi:hypothetical protein